MNKQTVREFFDGAAAVWDAEMIRDDAVIGRILDAAGIAAGRRVLDVACGTGVLMPDYAARGVRAVVGLDLSPEMVRIAAAKFPGVRFVCADAEEWTPDKPFDAVMVYNALPHFPDPARLVAHLSAMLCPGGTLTVAHGMSRARIEAHHAARPADVSDRLMPAEELAALFRAAGLEVTAQVDDEEMYLVSGRR